MKKVFIISSVLFFLVGSFYFAYNRLLFEGGKEKVVQNNTKEEQKNELNPDKIAQIAEGGIIGLSLNEDGRKIQYYNSADKGFWLTSFDGKSIKNRLSADSFDFIDQIIWNINKKEALLKIGDSFFVYSFGNKEKFVKKSHALNWINFDKNIIYTYYDANNIKAKKTLNIADLDGANWREIMVIGEDEKFSISNIPKSAKSSLWTYPDAFKESDLTIVPFGEGELEKIGGLKFGADYLWSNDGNKFLRSSVYQKGGNSLVLEVCDAKSNVCSNLNFPTLVSKCTWSNDNKNIFCAMPANIDKNAVMPNDYLNRKIFTKDSFWKINIESAKKEKVVEDKYINQDLDATNLLLSPNEDFLFFIDRKEGRLFRVIL